MTDEALKELVASLAVESKKTDEQLKKTDEQLKRTDEQLEKLTRKVDRIGTLVGNIANNQGDVAEEYFVNSLRHRLKIGEMEFDYLIPNYVIEGKKIRDEFDILLVNGESVAIIEVKYKVHPSDVEKLAGKIANLKRLPQYRGYRVYAGVAGFHVSDAARQRALERGYFVLQRRGKVVETYTAGMQAA
jgi:predicted ATP-grasp superfamily ATP-dependent carboligase